MKYRILLILILMCAIVVAAAKGTFSYYVDSTTFGFNIEPDISEPPPSDISVLYRTTNAWQSGGSGNYSFNYSITITNNSDQTIEAWYIRFTLSQDVLTGVWSAKMTTGLPAGTYEFVNPGYNNPATDNIAPGASVTFSGPATGHGQEAPQNVQVGGSNMAPTGALLTCEFGVLS